MGYLIRVTDVNVTSACTKERRSKIKLGREAFLNQKKRKKKTYLKRRKKIIMSPHQACRAQRSTYGEDHEFQDQQLSE